MSAITYDELEAHLHSGLSWMHRYLFGLQRASMFVYLYVLLFVLVFVVRRVTHIIERQDSSHLTEDQTKELSLHWREFISRLDRVIKSSSDIASWFGPVLDWIFRKLQGYRDRIEDRLESLELSTLSAYHDLIKEVESQIHHTPPLAVPQDWRAMLDHM
jgi:hypothetical protein